MLPAYDTSDPQPFAFRPVDEAIYHPSQMEAAGSMRQYPHSQTLYPQRRADPSQPPWSQHYPEGQYLIICCLLFGALLIQ